MREKDAIVQDLAREEERLAELERTQARIEFLRSELVTASTPEPPPRQLPLGLLQPAKKPKVPDPPRFLAWIRDLLQRGVGDLNP